MYILFKAFEVVSNCGLQLNKPTFPQPERHLIAL